MVLIASLFQIRINVIELRSVFIKAIVIGRCFLLTKMTDSFLIGNLGKRIAEFFLDQLNDFSWKT